MALCKHAYRVKEPLKRSRMLRLVSEESWVLIGKDGGLLAPIFPLADSEAWKEVIENLENFARKRGIMDLCNLGSPLESELDFFIHRLDEGEGRCAPPTLMVGNNPVFFEGEHLVLEIRNRSRVPLYIYILDIGLTGRISHVLPVSGSHEKLERGRSLLVGLRKELQLVIPEDFQHLDQETERTPIEGWETLILFAAPAPVDFQTLWQENLRFPRRSVLSLDDLLDATFHGGYGHMRTQEDWAAIIRTFRLRSGMAVPQSGVYAPS